MVMAVKHLLKKKALLCFRRERKNTHKNRGDEVKEKSPINSGNIPVFLTSLQTEAGERRAARRSERGEFMLTEAV